MAVVSESVALATHLRAHDGYKSCSLISFEVVGVGSRADFHCQVFFGKVVKAEVSYRIKSVINCFDKSKRRVYRIDAHYMLDFTVEGTKYQWSVNNRFLAEMFS